MITDRMKDCSIVNGVQYFFATSSFLPLRNYVCQSVSICEMSEVTSSTHNFIALDLISKARLLSLLRTLTTSV